MTDITGAWLFNGNGSTGSMLIYYVDRQGNLDLVVRFTGLDRVDRWQGVWNDTNKEITLTRALPNNTTQDHTGFLGDNDPNNLIFGGSFTESDVGGPRFNFGWFAQWQSPIIP
jgi:hypothetical protein